MLKANASNYIAYFKKIATSHRARQVWKWCMLFTSAVVFISGYFFGTAYSRKGNSGAYAVFSFLTGTAGFAYFYIKGMQLFSVYIDEIFEAMDNDAAYEVRDYENAYTSKRRKSKGFYLSPFIKSKFDCLRLPFINKQTDDEIYESVQEVENRVEKRKFKTSSVNSNSCSVTDQEGPNLGNGYSSNSSVCGARFSRDISNDSAAFVEDSNRDHDSGKRAVSRIKSRGLYLSPFKKSNFDCLRLPCVNKQAGNDTYETVQDVDPPAEKGKSKRGSMNSNDCSATKQDGLILDSEYYSNNSLYGGRVSREVSNDSDVFVSDSNFDREPGKRAASRIKSLEQFRTFYEPKEVQWKCYDCEPFDNSSSYDSRIYSHRRCDSYARNQRSREDANTTNTGSESSFRSSTGDDTPRRSYLGYSPPVEEFFQRNSQYPHYSIVKRPVPVRIPMSPSKTPPPALPPRRFSTDAKKPLPPLPTEGNFSPFASKTLSPGSANIVAPRFSRIGSLSKRYQKLTERYRMPLAGRVTSLPVNGKSFTPESFGHQKKRSPVLMPRRHNSYR